MTGTVRQDSEGMAEAIVDVSENLLSNKSPFDGIDEENIVENWRINIPYEKYYKQ